MRTLIVENSQNAKTGRVRVATYRTQDSCPPWCPLFGNGCYAENRMGRPSPFDTAERGTVIDDYTPLTELLDRVGEAIVRFNVSGDYLDENNEPDMAYIEATNHAKGDVLSYTHAWQVLDPKWFEDHTRPNASCDTMLDVAKARDMGWPTVIVDPGLEYGQMDGFIDCLYETKERQCTECRLCSRTARKSTVVFNVHGTRRRKAADAIAERIAS